MTVCSSPASVLTVVIYLHITRRKPYNLYSSPLRAALYYDIAAFCVVALFEIGSCVYVVIISYISGGVLKDIDICL